MTDQQLHWICEGLAGIKFVLQFIVGLILAILIYMPSEK